MHSAPHRSGGIRKRFGAPLGRLYSAVLLLTLAGCASGPTQYQVGATADAVINRDASGQPLSMVVRLYQLKGRSAFDQMTFDTAASGRDERELFGDELIARTELVMVPSSSRTLSETLAPEARYVGITGLFRQPDGQNWRLLIDAAAVRKRGLRILVEDCHLKVQDPEPLPIPGQTAGQYPDCRHSLPRRDQRTAAR